MQPGRELLDGEVRGDLGDEEEDGKEGGQEGVIIPSHIQLGKDITRFINIDREEVWRKLLIAVLQEVRESEEGEQSPVCLAFETLAIRVSEGPTTCRHVARDYTGVIRLDSLDPCRQEILVLVDGRLGGFCLVHGEDVVGGGMVNGLVAVEGMASSLGC